VDFVLYNLRWIRCRPPIRHGSVAHLVARHIMEHIDNKSKKWSLSVKPSHKSRGLITVDCVGRVRAAECRWQRRPPSVSLSVCWRGVYVVIVTLAAAADAAAAASRPWTMLNAGFQRRTARDGHHPYVDLRTSRDVTGSAGRPPTRQQLQQDGPTGRHHISLISYHPRAIAPELLMQLVTAERKCASLLV